MLKFPLLPHLAWVRVCQECMQAQVTKSPLSYKDDSWRNLRCRKCHSIALDYGQVNNLVEDNEE